MRLNEFNTTDPDTLMQKIVKDVVTGERTDCHGQCASAIRDGKLEDSDIVMIIGPKGTGGELGTHSVVIDKEGNLKVDSYGDRLKEYDKENGIFYYSGMKGMSTMTYKTYKTVGEIKKLAGTS